MKITKSILKQLIIEELKTTIDESVAGTRKKASRAIAMANQHLKQVTNIMAKAESQYGMGDALSGIEGAKAKDQLAQAIEQLQALDAYLENITGESGLYGGDRGASDKAVRQDVNPRPIRTRRKR